MNVIHKLPISLCNQIAAGEVVERPANIIKELVENSLDAGAQSIHIEIEHGGLQKIVVRDDGIGIAKEYLVTALERYTTSKIHSFEDMYALHTFGFRGEALASIASVSLLTLASAYKKENGEREETAYVTMQYGTLKEEGYTTPIDGTCITIENLFLNTPARLKFLKSASVEQKKCVDIFLRLVLMYLSVEFTFSVGGRKLFHFTKNQSLLERTQSIFPTELTECLTEFHNQYKSIVVRGLCSNPNITQKKADKLLLYVNNRSVNDKFLMRAVREGYKEYLTSKEYPFGVFFIELPPDEVDVNVHPTKAEVRFTDEGMCIKAIIVALKNALQYYSELPHEENMIQQSYSPLQSPFPPFSSLEKEERHSDIANYQRSSSPYDEEKIWEVPKQRIISTPRDIEESQVIYGRYSDESTELSQEHIVLQGADISDTSQETVYSQVRLMDTQYAQEQYRMPHIETTQSANMLSTESITDKYVFICTIAETYLVYRCIYNDELLIIDQHAAHERILEEYITRNASYNIQYLSPPVVFTLHPQEENRFLEISHELEELGFIITHTQGTISIGGIPSYLPQQRLHKYIKDILLDITDDMVSIIHKKACTNAIKKGDTLLPEDAYALLTQWLCVPHNTHCPHGRPISIRMHKSMIDHLFKRTV